MKLRDFPNAQKRREFIEEKLNTKLGTVKNFSFNEEETVGRNIENLIGSVEIPLAVAGPVKILDLGNEIYIPIATTEGALAASISRGCKAITESAGVEVFEKNCGITRGPVLKTESLRESMKVKDFVEKNFQSLAKACQSTSNHLKLLKIDSSIVGKNVFLRFYFETDQAMGMNMATIATEQAIKLIEERTQAVCISLAGNFDIDKKPAWLNFLSGRGRQVWAEAVIKRWVVEKILKTSPEKIAEIVLTKDLLGSAVSGSLGFNAHFANVIAAIFLATGQDIAHVVEGSLGITTAEVTEGGDLYFSIYLPSLLVGTIGGGTILPDQSQALSILGIQRGKDVVKFSRIIGAAVLAGELSLIASQAEGSLATVHRRFGRKNR